MSAIGDRSAAADVAGRTWGWLLAIGLLMIGAGVAAIAFPLASTLVLTLWLGWMLILGGVLRVAHAIFNRGSGGLIWGIVIGLLYGVAGLLIVDRPLAGALSVTILVVVLFLAQGVLEIVTALRLRPRRGWGWMLFVGATAILAGGLIFYHLPSSAAWAIALLVGINLIATGTGLVFLAFAARRGATLPG